MKSPHPYPIQPTSELRPQPHQGLLRPGRVEAWQPGNEEEGLQLHGQILSEAQLESFQLRAAPRKGVCMDLWCSSGI